MTSKQTAAYRGYLRSPEWQAFRMQCLKDVGFRCERCEKFGFTNTLQVHHMHYDTLFHETLDDVEVLCIACHKEADAERAYEDAFETWAAKVYGVSWMEGSSCKWIRYEFDDWWKDKQE